MAITFDGTTKTITLNSGTIVLDVIDLYSRWKDWIALNNAQYLPAFSPVGGDSIDITAGTSIPLYAFLINGWRIKPQEANHTLTVIGGVLLVDGGGDPFINPTGNFVIRINYQQPVQSIAVSSGGSSGGLTTLNVGSLVWSEILESDFDASKILRIMASVLAGKLTINQNNIICRNLSDDSDQMVGVAAQNGSRSQVTYGD